MQPRRDGVGPEDIVATYRRQAEAWDRGRSRTLFEQAWLARFRALVPAGAPILDAGCGTGEPIARALIEAGHPVTGIDAAAPMLAIARRRLPAGRWIEADMRSFDLGQRFGGIVAWNSFFHLAPAEQPETLGRFARHLDRGGALLFTAGPEAGEPVGRVGSEPVYHASLSPPDYVACLDGAGLAVRGFLAEDPDCAGHSVWLARRR